MRFKICCISSVEEALLAKSYGAYALGLVGPMPSGPGIINNSLINTIALHNEIHNFINTFLLSSENNCQDIVAHYHICNTTHIQLVDEVPNTDLKKLKELLPHIKLVQVIHVISEASIEMAVEKEAFADYILLDSGNPNLTIKELGGTGKTHNWSLSRKIVEQCSKPVFLAGGLHAKNIAAAIEQVQPYGVDICSGIRTNKALDEDKLNEFVKIVANY